MIQYRIQLYCNIRSTPQHIILRMGSLIIVTIRTHSKLRFREIFNHITMMYYPLVLNLKQDSQNRRNKGVFSILFLTLNWWYYPGQKWHYRADFNNAPPRGNQSWWIHFHSLLNTKEQITLFISLLTSITNEMLKYELPLLYLMTHFLCFYR